MKNAVRVACAAGLAVGLPSSLPVNMGVSLPFDLPFTLAGGVQAGVALGAPIAILSWLFFGGFTVMQHAVLRLILFHGACVPLNYVRFLDYASERIFLRKVGGGYIFVHRLLQDHFASKWKDDMVIVSADGSA
jgi:hypothetical protein